VTWPGFSRHYLGRETRSLPVAPAVSAPTNTTTARPRFRPKFSTGDNIIRWFSYLHLGNFCGWPGKALWVLVRLAPAFLFGTGVLMWWNRVRSPAARRLRRASVAGI